MDDALALVRSACHGCCTVPAQDLSGKDPHAVHALRLAAASSGRRARLKAVPPELLLFVSLTELDLSGHHIQAVEHIYTLRRLVKLNLSRNHLRRLPLTGPAAVGRSSGSASGVGTCSTIVSNNGVRSPSRTLSSRPA